MGQTTFSDNEIKTLRQICVIFNDKLVSKKQRKLKSYLNFKIFLSNRDIRILKLICRQYGTEEIADKMGLSYSRVDQIRGELLKKTESKNVIGLVLFAVKHKIHILK